jgi:hypothetical protein
MPCIAIYAPILGVNYSFIDGQVIFGLRYEILSFWITVNEIHYKIPPYQTLLR